jgi:hypothetical protein
MRINNPHHNQIKQDYNIFQKLLISKNILEADTPKEISRKCKEFVNFINLKYKVNEDELEKIIYKK